MWDCRLFSLEAKCVYSSKDASSIDYLEWSKVSQLGENWIVRCKYKGTNSMGAIVTENVWFYIQNNKVVDTKSIE